MSNAAEQSDVVAVLAEKPSVARDIAKVLGEALGVIIHWCHGPRGPAFLAQTLARGHFVTIFVRNVSKLLLLWPHIRVCELHEADKRVDLLTRCGFEGLTLARHAGLRSDTAVRR